MLTADELDTLTDPILALYEEYNQSVINDIARRLAGMNFASAAWQMQRLTESGMVYKNALKELAKMTGKSEKELREIFKRAGVKAMAFDDAVYKAAGLNPLPLNLSPAMARVLAAGLAKTQGVLNNMTLTTAMSGQQAFLKAADLAYMQVASGAMSYDQAIREAIKKVANDGLSVINYASGKTDQLDVAMRRTVLTGVSQTSGQLQITRADEMGSDLVAVSAHIGARNTGEGVANHEAWQGQVYSRSGTHKKYKPFVETTGYGTGAGLMGWNCRHSFYPFFEGISKEIYSKKELESYANKTVTYNGREMSVYEATQQQRGIERDIRKWKRIAGAKESAGKDNSAELAQVKKYQAKMRDFVKETGLDRQRVRESVILPKKKIDFASEENQYVAHIGNIQKNFLNSAGHEFIVPRPVIYNNFTSRHLLDESHKIRLQWLKENQENIIRAISHPEIVEANLRYRADGHYSITQIVEVAQKDEKRNYLAVAISLSKENADNSYHQITTIYPIKQRDLFLFDGRLKIKYKLLK